MSDISLAGTAQRFPRVAPQPRMECSLVRVLAVLACSVWMAAAAVSCNSVTAPPSESAVAREFKLPATSDSGGAAVDNLDIYIDGSQSMQGFTAIRQSNFCTMIGEIMLQAEAAQFHLTTYKFASEITKLDNPSLNQLQSPDFYRGHDTRLAELLRVIGSRPQDSAVIISDLVQSEPGSDSQALVEELAAIGASTRQMDLIAYRSSFDGTYDPEYKSSDHPGKLRLKVSQQVPDQGRPYYLLVIAPNTASLEKIKDHLLAHRPPLREFDATQVPIKIDSITLNGTSPGVASWALYSRFSPVNDGTDAFATGFLWQGADSSPATVDLPVTMQVSSQTPIRQPDRLDLRVDQADWNGNSFGQPRQVAIPLGGSIIDGEHLQLTLTLDKPAKGTWSTYFIRIGSGDGNLDIPQWISAWSTDDDSTLSDGNRTYELRLLALAMVNAISEREESGEWILKIGRGA